MHMSCQNNEISSTFDTSEAIPYILHGIEHIGDELSILSWLRMKAYRKPELTMGEQIQVGLDVESARVR